MRSDDIRITRQTDVLLSLVIQAPFTAFGATSAKPLPFHLPDTTNMTTSDAQLEERRRAAIREREREAQAKERNRQLLSKRREDQLRLKNQVEEEAKNR